MIDIGKKFKNLCKSIINKLSDAIKNYSFYKHKGCFFANSGFCGFSECSMNKNFSKRKENG